MALPPLIARGQCIEQRGAGEPYLPVLEALGRLCMQPGGAPLVELLRRHAPAWLVQLPGLLEPTECEALERRLGATTRERMLREMAAVVAALPAPLVLVLEDLHWSDHATLELLSTLAQRRDPARLLLIGTYRPVDVTVRNHPLRSMHQDLRAHGQVSGSVADAAHGNRRGGVSARALAPARGRRRAGARCCKSAPTAIPSSWSTSSITSRSPARSPRSTANGGSRRDSRGASPPPSRPRLRQLIGAQCSSGYWTMRGADRIGGGEPGIGRRFSAALVAAALDAEVVAIEERLARLAHNGSMVVRRRRQRMAGRNRRPAHYRFDPLLNIRWCSATGSSGAPAPAAPSAPPHGSKASVCRPPRRGQPASFWRCTSRPAVQAESS